MTVNKQYPDYQSPDDSTSHSLLDALSDGDESAWEKIALVWGPVLFQYFRRRELTNSDAEEVVQNVMLRMYQGLKKRQFVRDGEAKRLKYWIFKIAENELKTFYTRFLNRPKSPGGSSYQNLVANVEAETEASALESLAITRILELIEGDFQKVTWNAFQLRYFDSLSFADIGEKLSISEESAKQGVYRVRQRLRQEMERLNLFSEKNNR
ncbi:MAG: RNA polymerase sigma factor [Pirellulaceae bacterium]